MKSYTDIDEAYKKVAVRFGSNVADEIFLKESEGERIRKEIIDFATKVSKGITSILANNYDFNKWIAWLEKQGETQNNVYDKELSEILGRVIRRYINDPSIPYTKREKVSMEIIPYVERLEKQGEQKSNKCIYSNDNYTDEDRLILCAGCEEDCKLKKKPIGKVEPKFKVGDWIVSPNGVYWHIDAIRDGRYQVSSDSDESTDWPLDTNIYHKFTIQDAKDGDVLVASDKSLFIYDGSINENGSVGFHITLTEDMDIILNSDDGCGWEEKDSCRPATKEQRDTLMKAMTDAGYTFNFEKKELKKIIDEKQIKKNLQDNSFRRMFEQKQVIDYPDSLPKDNWELIHEFVNKFGRIPKDEDELNVLIEYVLKRQNPAWSEEDEKIRKALFEYFTTSDNNAYYEVCGVATKKILVWLDKQREQKSTWSEEDKELLNDIIVDVEVLKEQDRTKEGKAAYKREIDWLKSLEIEPQPKQEWSEEDERVLCKCLGALGNPNYCYEDRDLEHMRNWLKSLRPQNTWKPSDEQLEALDDFIYATYPNIEKYGAAIKLLYQDLKKLRKE